jgi:hypothetical protein
LPAGGANARALAGSTIDVWNAWLTGNGTTSYPALPSACTASSTAGLAPPITACLSLLRFAMTT